MKNNSKNDLVERYIYAVSKKLPRKLRKDVSDELNSIISDMLEERCGSLVPSEKDVLMVLTELGTPHELAVKYKGNAQDCLIGEPHFSSYLWWLKLAAVITIIISFINHITLFFSRPPSNYIVFVLELIPELISNFFTAFGIVTLIFAVLYYKGIRVESEAENLLDLPEVSKKSNEISKWDCIWTIGFSVLFIVLFLGIPGSMSIFKDGVQVPVFNIEMLRNYWYILVAIAGVGIIDSAFGLLEKRYTTRVMIVNLISNIIEAGLFVFMFTRRQVFNPDAIYALTNIFDDVSDTAVNLITNAQSYFLVLILLGIAFDAGYTAFKTMQAKETQ